MIFDSHAHYDDEAFDADRDQVLKEVKESKVSYIVNAGSSIESSKRGIELSGKYDFIYAAVGIHPHDAKNFDKKSIEVLKDLAAFPKVVAIGEIGLDYYYDFSYKEDQIKAFEEQIKLGLELNLPIIVHDRDAHSDTFEIIKKYIKDGLKGIIHCYSGSAEMAVQYTKLGFYIGLGGVITFKNAVKSLEVLKNIPQDKILIETDCPYLTPVPHRGKRNDSRYLKYVVDKAAEVLAMDREEFIKLTCENGKRIFNMK
ncbi:putative deoxyribonuclease YcfH [Oxobacter pfennigii]|uniref:Putative deoxyribonuclease YcfH n=1 Tax=Oxobacter pfennigii TaxID=36849 RepID=A0A0P8WXK9_9CLOT|nr:TatD family hydrolase [Oxobacter pfennigii]KPU43085.1 putative deoxyribonuclease YcfH [Oxobacter pfennigii]